MAVLHCVTRSVYAAPGSMSSFSRTVHVDDVRRGAPVEAAFEKSVALTRLTFGAALVSIRA